MVCGLFNASFAINLHDDSKKSAFRRIIEQIDKFLGSYPTIVPKSDTHNPHHEECNFPHQSIAHGIDMWNRLLMLHFSLTSLIR
jgi:hypothetical protein